MLEKEVDTESATMGSKTQVSLQIGVAPDTTRKYVSVLTLLPEWKLNCNRLNITKSLIKNLRSVDPEGKVIQITCAVLDEEGNMSDVPKVVEEDLKYQSRGYMCPKDEKKANVLWLNKDVLKYEFDFIIGHAPYFTDSCFNYRDSCKKHGYSPQVILFAHDLPHGNGKTAETQLRDLLRKSDVIFSMKKSIENEINRQIKQLKEEKDEHVPQHRTYIPGYPVEFFKMEERRVSQNKSSTKIMMIAPMKKDEMKGFDFSLAVKAVARACGEFGKTSLTLLTENIDDKEEWKKQYKCVLKNPVPKLKFRCQPLENLQNLKHFMRKCDLFLFPLSESFSLFGEEALLAIACGVPVLVSRHSGVGSFLEEMNEKDSVVDELKKKSWAKRIYWKLKNPTNPLDLRERLLLDTRIASTHQDFMKLISG